MLGFSPLASKAIADDGIVRFSFTINTIVIDSPTVDTPTFKVDVNLTSVVSIGSPLIDVSTLTLNYDFDAGEFVISSPIIGSIRIVGAPALSRVDIDGASAIRILDVPVSLLLNAYSATDTMLLDSKSNVILDGDGVTVVIIDESDNDLAEVA